MDAKRSAGIVEEPDARGELLRVGFPSSADLQPGRQPIFGRPAEVQRNGIGRPDAFAPQSQFWRNQLRDFRRQFRRQLRDCHADAKLCLWPGAARDLHLWQSARCSERSHRPELQLTRAAWAVGLRHSPAILGGWHLGSSQQLQQRPRAGISGRLAVWRLLDPADWSARVGYAEPWVLAHLRCQPKWRLL